MMDVTLIPKVLAGEDLKAKADGTLQEIGEFGTLQIALDLRLKTNRGTGKTGDGITFSAQGFHMTDDCYLGSLDVSTSTLFYNSFNPMMLRVEPGSNNPPAKLFMQSNRDLRGLDWDATVLLIRGQVVEPPQE